MYSGDCYNSHNLDNAVVADDKGVFHFARELPEKERTPALMRMLAEGLVMEFKEKAVDINASVGKIELSFFLDGHLYRVHTE